jgi:hypothetical protein
MSVEERDPITDSGTAIQSSLLVQPVQPAHLCRALELEGWALTAQREGRGTQWEKQKGSILYSVVVPESVQLPSFERLIAEDFEILSEAMGWEWPTFKTWIQNPGSDITTIRAFPDQPVVGIPSSKAKNFYGSSVAALTSSVRAARLGKPVRQLRTKQVRAGEEFTFSTTIAPASHGSYLIDFVTDLKLKPTAHDSEDGLYPDAGPLRNGTRSFLKTFGAAADAIAGYRSSVTLDGFTERLRLGITAEFCSALAGMLEVDGDIDVDVRFALRRPEKKPRGSVRIGQAGEGVLRRAAAELRDSPPESVTLSGTIEEFKWRSGHQSGAIELLVKKGELRGRYRVVLDDAETLKKLAASSLIGEQEVLVNGDLVVVTGQKFLLDAVVLEVDEYSRASPPTQLELGVEWPS